MLIGTGRVPSSKDPAHRRRAAELELADGPDRDVAALAWDLTVYQLRRAFARSVGPSLRGDTPGSAAGDLGRVRVAAARHVLDELRDALRRDALGEYGRCVDCGRCIGADRLDADPAARRCVPCETSAG